jgi:tRNA/rRNA methyltransferase
MLPGMNTDVSERISVILVEPQNPGNIGMVARAMGNFGVGDLRLVNPCPHLHPEARKFAVGAAPLLGRARLYADLNTALADLPLAIAATRRPGKLRGELLDVAEAANLALSLPGDERLGLVFGREDSGLTSAEVSLCTHSAAIATAEQVGSMNLAQAVLLFLYEFTRSPRVLPAAPQPAGQRPAAAECEALFAQMESVLTRIAFLNPARPAAVMNRLRRMLHQAAIDREDLSLLRGMWTQLSWSINDWRGRKRGG